MGGAPLSAPGHTNAGAYPLYLSQSIKYKYNIYLYGGFLPLSAAHRILRVRFARLPSMSCIAPPGVLRVCER